MAGALACREEVWCCRAREPGRALARLGELGLSSVEFAALRGESFTGRALRCGIAHVLDRPSIRLVRSLRTSGRVPHLLVARAIRAADSYA